MVMIIFLAGFVTTTNLIGNGLLALLRHPDELRRLRDEPALVQPAVQEMLRYDPPVQVVMRTALQASEVGGRRVEVGESVVGMVGAAKPGPRPLPDPDRFDAGRTNGQALSFGWASTTAWARCWPRWRARSSSTSSSAASTRSPSWRPTRR